MTFQTFIHRFSVCRSSADSFNLAEEMLPFIRLQWNQIICSSVTLSTHVMDSSLGTWTERPSWSQPPTDSFLFHHIPPGPWMSFRRSSPARLFAFLWHVLCLSDRLLFASARRCVFADVLLINCVLMWNFSVVSGLKSVSAIISSLSPAPSPRLSPLTPLQSNLITSYHRKWPHAASDRIGWWILVS